MAKQSKPDMSCARIKEYQSSDIGAAERHIERQNKEYDNINVVPERIPYNVYFRTPASSYMDMLRTMEAEEKVSLRGLRQDATLFDEIIVDVNTMYFERNGSYEYAKKFYEEAYRFIEKKYGSEYILSAVMHADELNKAATDDLGREVYHYHLHAVALPVVEKEVLWSKRCKNPALRGTVKEVIRQISHSKKWESKTPLTNEHGEIVLRKNGKPKYRASYSILQDEVFEHLQEHGFTGFQRGERGSTKEHLESLQYQIEKDKERLADIQKRIEAEKVRYEPVHNIHKTLMEIEGMGQKTITGKVSVSKTDYEQLTSLAKEGVTGRMEISKLRDEVSYYQQRYYNSANAFERLQERYSELKEKCKPFLQALELFPQLVRPFVDKVKELLNMKETQERKEREDRIAARKEPSRRSRDKNERER